MPSKYYQRNFISGSYYHLYNRGSRKNNIFNDPQDYDTFTDIVSYYLKFPQGIPLSYKQRLPKTKNDNSFVKSSFSVIAFCFMPNHYHFLLHQKTEPENNNGIPNFIKRLSITYSLYFKNKHDHSGSLFEGKYKNTSVRSEEQLIYLTKYIHRNPSNISKLDRYPYSSYTHYLKKQPIPWVKSKEILLFFSNNYNASYKSFVEEDGLLPPEISSLTID